MLQSKITPDGIQANGCIIILRHPFFLKFSTDLHTDYHEHDAERLCSVFYLMNLAK
jgi:hypothetical protein